MGEVEDVASGKTKRLTIKLASGHYVIICNKHQSLFFLCRRGEQT